jgi:hypothetical protein
MRFATFFILLFVTDGCLLGAPVKNPFPNFGAVIIIWVIYYLLTAPRRRRNRYWRERRQLQAQYMRAWLRDHGYRY